MLKELRKKKNVKRYIIWLIILIVPAFFFWGVQTVRTSSVYVLKAFGMRVNLPQFIREMEKTRLSLMYRNPAQFSKIQKNINMEMETIRRLILLLDAKHRKLKATDQELVKTLKSIPYFKSKGNFSKNLYFKIVKGYFRTQPYIFEDMLKEEIIFKKLRDEVTKNIKVDEKEIEDLYRKENHKIKISYIKIPLEKLLSKIVPTPQQLEEYYNRHKEKYRLAPRIKIKYVKIPAQILKQTLKRIKRMKRLEDISQFMGLPVLESNYFSLKEPIEGIGQEPQVNQIAFDLDAGRTSGLIPIKDGFLVIEVADKKPSSIPEFRDVEKIVKEDFSRKKAQEEAMKLAEKIKESLLKGDEEIVRSQGIKIEETKLFALDEYIPGIGKGEQIFKSLPKNSKDWSEPCLLGNSVFLFKLIEEHKPQEEDFQKQKDKIRKELLTYKKGMAFLQYMDRLFQNPDVIINTDLLSQKSAR